MKTQKFTLIEILTVIAIIVVLMGILVPTVGTAMNKARNNSTKSSIKTLQVAIKQYETTYGYLPMTPGIQIDTVLSSAQYRELLDALSARSGFTHLNPRKVKFLEVDTNFNFQDYWGNDLRVALDLDYSGSIDDNVVNGNEGLKGDLNTSIGIWSLGKDGLENQDPPGPTVFLDSDGGETNDSGLNDDNLHSWEK